MDWLNKIVDQVVKHRPDGEIVVSSGVSPSGAYHVGTLREVLTAEIVARELRYRGRDVQHIHVSDDLDVFRKVPVNLDDSYQKYLGMPLCDLPAPDESGMSYADYYVKDLHAAAKTLNLDIEIVRAHERYRSGYFVPAIERALCNIEEIKEILVAISGHKLNESWSPVQIQEEGYLKNRRFEKIDENAREVTYLDKNDGLAEVSYAEGKVKLNWRIDWPARWWLMKVDVEPFGRDHATKGGSYDTGVELVRQIFESEPPIPIPYEFINKTGQTKKMSKSAGDTITSSDLIEIMPPEMIWYFMFQYPPSKKLYFDEGPTLIQLFDEFSELQAKPEKSDQESQLLRLCTFDVKHQTVSSVPFSHLVSSYQAALRDTSRTIQIIARSEHKAHVENEADIIARELQFIAKWLDNWAPEDVKFELTNRVPDRLSESEKIYFSDLADKLEAAPEDADGEWFHKAIYSFKDTVDLESKMLFVSLYRLLINKDSGPRAGWFLSILPRKWLLNRLRLES